MKKKVDKFSLKDHSTDTVTPPQLGLKQPAFHVPTGSNTGEPVEVVIEVEYYNVLYTKHITQKSKVWDDGFLEHNIKSSRVSWISFFT